MLVIGTAVLSTGQTPSSDWISQIDIPALNPFQVSFRLTNCSATALENVSGRAILANQFGQTIEVLAIESFSVPPNGNKSVSTASRW
ncbi:MAG: hypothetical protein V3T03_02815, partial [Candidatus Bipolaricaulota bacterium]